MKNYYTAKEAQDRLGINDNNFYYLVRTGKIKKSIPPGKKQGRYPKAEIDRLAREMIAFMAYDEQQGLQFMKATPDDIREEYELALLVYGNAPNYSEARLAWLNKNPDVDFIVRDHGRFVGFINVLPVKHETIVRFMDGEIRGWELTADDILLYTPGETYECIIMNMTTSPDVDRRRRAQYGAKLISGLMGFMNELARQQVSVTRFYATSATPTGIAILRNAGFQETGQIGKRIKFELDPMRSDNLVVAEYKQTLLSGQIGQRTHYKRGKKN